MWFPARTLEDDLQSIGSNDLNQSTVVIGDIARWSAEGKITIPLEKVHFVNLTCFSEGMLGRLKPELVLSPLVGKDFDVIDVATRLWELDYKGRYRAIAVETPNVNMIKREVSLYAEGLDFDVLVLSTPGSL